MANKLPWFTHDHNARNDDFIRRAEDRFGHFGYAGYFKILEVLHEHGSGDKLRITKSRLSQELRSRWPQVRLLLDFCRTSGKISSSVVGLEVNLEVPKFRERQSKLKSNLPSTFPQPSANLPIHREGEGDREGHKQTMDLSSSSLKALIASAAEKTDPGREAKLLGMKMPFGEHEGAVIQDMDPELCAYYLSGADSRIGPELQDALRLRVEQKAQECKR